MTTKNRSLTEQERFWQEEFGAEYMSRNRGDAMLSSNLHLFGRVLESCRGGVGSVFEFGANIGMNLRALRMLLPHATLSALELNQGAAQELSAAGICEEVVNASIFDYEPAVQSDFVLIKGVMIHLNPNLLEQAYSRLTQACGRYLCVVEYYNPVPVEVSYRGHAGRLFKRDFAGEILDRYPEFRLRDYGFVYRRDPLFPADDVTWFLLEKTTVHS